MKLFGTSKRKQVIAICLIAFLLLGLVSFCFGRFSYTSICTKCGSELHASDYHLAFLDIIIFSQSKVNATPFSTALASGNSTGACHHQWLFAGGGGNGVTCAIGSGRHLWSTIRSTNVASLLTWNQKYGGPQFQAELVQVALDPDLCGAVETLSFLIPDTGFTSAAEYQIWLGENKKYFDGEVATRKQIRLP